LGLPVVAVYGRLALIDPAQTEGLAPRVIVGIGFTLTLITFVGLLHPVKLLDTVSVPVYVAGGAAPGITMTIGEAGRIALVTFTNPAASAAALYVMLYLSGLPVVAVYGRLALVDPAHTVGFAPIVIVGTAIVVTLKAIDELVQPVAVLVTVNVPE